VRNPKIKKNKDGWQCVGEVGHFRVAQEGNTIAEAYVRYHQEMSKLIKESLPNAHHQSRK
jgi:hypothetical protein